MRMVVWISILHIILSLPYLPDRMSAPVDDTHKLNEQVHTHLNGNWWAPAREIGNAFPHLEYHHQGHKWRLSDPLTMHFKPFPSIRDTPLPDFAHQNAINNLKRLPSASESCNQCKYCCSFSSPQDKKFFFPHIQLVCRQDHKTYHQHVYWTL